MGKNKAMPAVLDLESIELTGAGFDDEFLFDYLGLTDDGDTPDSPTEENDNDEGEVDLLDRQEKIHSLARERMEEQTRALLNGRDADLLEKVMKYAAKSSDVYDNLRNIVRQIFGKAAKETSAKKEGETDAEHEGRRAKAFKELLEKLVGDKSCKYDYIHPEKGSLLDSMRNCTRVAADVRGSAFTAFIRKNDEGFETKNILFVGGIKIVNNFIFWRGYRRDEQYVSLDDAVVYDIGMSVILKAIEEKAEHYRDMSAEEQTSYRQLLDLLAERKDVDKDVAEKAGIEEWEKRIFRWSTKNYGDEVYRTADYAGYERLKKDCHFEGMLRYILEARMRNEDVSAEIADISLYDTTRGNQLKWEIGYYIDHITDIARKISGCREMRKISREHAKSFQTKKNIPEKTKKLMNELSGKVFGFVEADMDCDIEKVRLIHSEIAAFKERFLKGITLSGSELRFRRLGNHHASGLYYPYFGCLCVDINSPSSFVHELGHLLDHQLPKGRENLSDKDDFRRIRRLYERNFNSGGQELKGKYDRNYFLMPTEIFARSFEIYMSAKINADICMPKDDVGGGFAYPDDEVYVREVNKYFDNLLAHLDIYRLAVSEDAKTA